MSFAEMLDHLSNYRANESISGIDMFKFFVGLECLDMAKCQHDILIWKQRVCQIVKFEVHPITIFILTRIYYLCATLYSFGYAQTTKLFQYRRIERYPTVIKDAIQLWRDHVQEGHLVDQELIGGPCCAHLTKLETKCAQIFKNETKFVNEFPCSSLKEEELFHKFRIALRRSQTNYVKGVHLFDMFRDYETEDVLSCFQRLNKWTKCLSDVEYEFEPVTVFLFSRMFVGMSKYDLELQNLLSRQQITFQDVSSLIRENVEVLNKLWSHLQAWTNYIEQTQEFETKNICKLVFDSRCLTTLCWQHDKLHAPKFVKKFVVTPLPKCHNIVTIIAKWRCLVKHSKQIIFKVVAKWKVLLVQKQSKQTVVSAWTECHGKGKKSRLEMLLFWKCETDIRLFQRQIILSWQRSIVISKEHLYKFKRWRKRAKKLLCQERKMIIQQEKKTQQLLRKAIIHKYWNKWKLFVLQRAVVRSQKQVRLNRVALFVAKRKTKILSEFVQRWKMNIVNRKMNEFVWEKQLIGFTAQILSACMQIFDENVMPKVPCSDCPERKYNCGCEFQKWSITKLLFTDFCELVKNVIVVSTDTTFQVISKALKYLFSHSFTGMLVELKLLRNYATVLELTHVLHASFNRTRKLFIQITRFGIKAKMSTILYQIARFQTCANKKGQTKWMKRYDIPVVFGQVSYSHCEIGVALWFEITNEYLKLGGKQKEKHFSIFKIIAQKIDFSEEKSVILKRDESKYIFTKKEQRSILMPVPHKKSDANSID